MKNFIENFVVIGLAATIGISAYATNSFKEHKEVKSYSLDVIKTSTSALEEKQLTTNELKKLTPLEKERHNSNLKQQYAVEAQENINNNKAIKIISDIAFGR